jgi:hypothetical protein
VGKCGRKPVLDEGKRREILAILSVGCSQTTAARYVGCAQSTIQRTAERDAGFAEKLRRAICSDEIGLLRHLRNAAKDPKYWRAAAWALERGFPDRYGVRGPDVITVKQITQMLTQIADIVSQDVPELCRKKILKRLDRLTESLQGKPMHGRSENVAQENQDEPHEDMAAE